MEGGALRSWFASRGNDRGLLPQDQEPAASRSSGCRGWSQPKLTGHVTRAEGSVRSSAPWPGVPAAAVAEVARLEARPVDVGNVLPHSRSTRRACGC